MSNTNTGNPPRHQVILGGIVTAILMVAIFIGISNVTLFLVNSIRESQGLPPLPKYDGLWAAMGVVVIVIFLFLCLVITLVTGCPYCGPDWSSGACDWGPPTGGH